MTKLKRFIYISDRKVNAYKEQIKRGLKLNLDWELSLKVFLAELRGKTEAKKEPKTIYQDLKTVIDKLEKDHSIGTFADLDNFDYPWIRMSDEFRYEVMRSGISSPHFRWLCLKDYGHEKRIVYLVGSLAYGLPRTSTWKEPEDLYGHFDQCLDDLEAHDWDQAARNLANEVMDYTGKLGAASKIETVFEILHRSSPIEKWDGSYRVTFGTPLYVASIA